jgi:hypothetical protein
MHPEARASYNKQAADSQGSKCSPQFLEPAKQAKNANRKEVFVLKNRAPMPIKPRMARWYSIIVALGLICGCGGKTGRMEQPENPTGRYREQIAVARRVLDQREDWADRAEWEVVKSGGGWQVTAWRVEHPERKGPERYLPWGYSVIQLDSRMVAVGYRRKG